MNAIVAKKEIDIYGMRTKLGQHVKVCPSCDNKEWARVLLGRFITTLLI